MNHQFACSSMMLPEHRSLLRRALEEERRLERCRNPVLDEQELERFQRALELSLCERVPLKLTVSNGDSCQSLKGYVHKIEPWAGRLRLNTDEGIKTVLVCSIINIAV